MTDDAADYGSTQTTSSCNNSLNRHWSTAFISIEFEIPPVTSVVKFDFCVAMEWDSERWIRLQFVKRTVLE